VFGTELQFDLYTAFFVTGTLNICGLAILFSKLTGLNALCDRFVKSILNLDGFILFNRFLILSLKNLFVL